MAKKEKKGELPEIHLRQAFEYSVKDDLAGAGMMLRALRACVNISLISGKINKEEHKEITKKLNDLESRPSEKLRGSIYTLCETYTQNPDELQCWNENKEMTGYSSPQVLKTGLRNAMDELTIIAADLTKTLGLENTLIRKQLKGMGVNEGE